MAKKYGVLVGCNYPNTKNELHGCINDVNLVQGMLGRFGFDEKDVDVLTDFDGSQNMPTGVNIRSILKQKLGAAKPGDVVFLFYSGHGTVIPASLSSSGKDEEAIVPTDKDLITCVDFRSILDGAPEGVAFVIVSDSCFSGGLIDKEKEQIGPNHPPADRLARAGGLHPRIRMIPFETILELLSPQAPPNTLVGVQALFHQSFGSETCSPIFRSSVLEATEPLKSDQGILLSGCQSNEFSAEIVYDDGIAHGMFTHSLNVALKADPAPITNRKLVVQTRKILQDSKNEKQHPCLYCSDENADAFFLLQDLN